LIVGLGLDLFDVARLEHEVQRHGSAAALKVFSSAELEACDAHRRPMRALASCFAAKEALFKALRLDVGEGWRWRDVEVSAGVGAPPALALRGRLADLARQRGADRILLSLASTRRHVCATVVLEKRA